MLIVSTSVLVLLLLSYPSLTVSSKGSNNGDDDKKYLTPIATCKAANAQGDSFSQACSRCINEDGCFYCSYIQSSFDDEDDDDDYVSFGSQGCVNDNPKYCDRVDLLDSCTSAVVLLVYLISIILPLSCVCCFVAAFIFVCAKYTGVSVARNINNQYPPTAGIRVLPSYAIGGGIYDQPPIEATATYAEIPTMVKPTIIQAQVDAQWVSLKATDNRFLTNNT